MIYDSTQDTTAHIARVRALLSECIGILEARAEAHDASKLCSPEKGIFDEWIPKLRTLTYGSSEYKAALEQMGEGLKHHYRHNSHHPEHYPGGVNDMSLFDILEMLCDWKAAGESRADGDMESGLRINAARFGIERQLGVILANTAEEMGWIQHR